MRVRYCGGCRAQYDRVGAVESVRRRLGDRVRFVTGDDEGAVWELRVSGCATACADEGEGAVCPVRSIRNPEEAEAWASLVEGSL